MPLSVRREDRRNLGVGFISLLAIMTAHSVMETARDALFLAKLPAAQLPWAYLAIAVLATLELQVHERVLRHIRDRRALLSVSLMFGALITFGFWVLLGELGSWGPFAFYVWTGLLITVVLIEFWLLLDDTVTVTQAKRIFPPIAAGGVGGAMFGSFLAGGLLEVVTPQGLLLAAALVLAGAATTPFLWRKPVPTAAHVEAFAEKERSSLLWLVRDGYLSRLLVLVLIGTITLTVVDFVFKSTVADHIPAEGLGPFFARFYFGLNSVALVVQVVVAGWLLRAFGVHRSSALLPVLILAGSLGLVVGPPLIFAVALKAADGSFRHTLYRTGIEVLFLPLDSARRERAKGLIEVFGHRVGQAVASVLILVAVALGLTTPQLGWILLIPVVIWLFAIMATRDRYVELFRSRLRQGVIETQLELEELDLHSLEALLNALNSDQDAEVLAAIDIFDRHGKANLIPVLVLYHPAKEVRLRALETFAEAADPRIIPVARRMLTDDDSDIRAAALRALTAVEPNKALLQEKLDLEASIVQATALVGLLSMNHGKGDGPVFSGVDSLPTTKSLPDKLEEWIETGNVEAQSSLARAIRREGGAVFHEPLIRLIETEDDSVRLETLRAMEAIPDPSYLPFLLPLLGNSELRAVARRAMVTIGPAALEFLDKALSDPSVPHKVRRRLPYAIIRFEPQDAARVLLAHLEREHNGAVRFKILQSLGRLRATHPTVRLDEHLLSQQLKENLRRVLQLLRWRAAIETDRAPDTADRELLRVALRDKESTTLERAFWLMGLQHPSENFTLVWRGLKSENARVRAASREVLEAVLSGSLRDAVLALVDVGEAVQRRVRAAASALGVAVKPTHYEDALDAMVQDRSEVVRGIAAHHAAELAKRSGVGSSAQGEVSGLA